MDKNAWKLWIAFWICFALAFFIVPSILSTMVELEKIKQNCPVEVVKDE
jgi:uncharacterized membrane protein